MTATRKWTCQGCGLEIRPGDHFDIIEGMIVCCPDCADDHDPIPEPVRLDCNATASKGYTGIQMVMFA